MLLFLDVDGTLLPFGASRPYPVYEPEFAPPVAAAPPLLTRIDPSLGPRLAALRCELVWATTWMDDANVCVAPWLGLPQLPLVDWPDPAEESAGGSPVSGLHWKTRPLVAWAAGRPFIWVDDEIRDADRDWVTAHHPERALLHRVDHRYGITDADLDAVRAWLDANR
ncbi:HAD domain-containing protein [Streptomyces prunicolor]|uniref:HAD domain-containing protein n=1 Tax=Streptomyces prunicolor TaxID=67348 RepID=UPI0005BDDC8B|nr:HAD domain-containing protein [Streptomyces prunicolor]